MIPTIEKASLAAIKAYQEEKLQALLAYVAKHSPFYQRHFATHGIAIDTIKTIEDLQQIPTTTKEDLQLYNDDFICVPKRQIVDYVTTSGTLGDPVTIGLTDADLERLAHNEAMSFACAGVTEDDVLQLMTTIDRRFMAGLAYFLGARKLGAGIVRVGAGIPELQWDTITKIKPTYLVAVPSFLLKMIAYAKANGIDLNQSSVKGAICIGEPIRHQDFSLNTLGQHITTDWDIQLYSTYASTEMSAAFTECEAQQGGHHHPELIITELLDDNEQPVAEGEVGELTITTLGVEGVPLVRFKTGDMMTAITAPCSCGRTSMRLKPVVGRKKQMIKYKGTSLYPPAMQNVLSHFTAIESYVIELNHNDIGTDEILIKIATASPSEQLLQQIKDHFRAKIRVLPKIAFHDSKEIQALNFPKMSRKPIFIIDKR